MLDIRRYLLQALLYALFFLPIVWLTHLPIHRHLDEGMAELKLAVRHAGTTVGECKPVTAGAYTPLPGDKERPQICPRERSPLRIELLLDGEVLYRGEVAAPGLHNDGVASIYQRFSVPAGAHKLELRMNDDVAKEGFVWELEENIRLRPAQVLVASFKEGFQLL